MPKKKSGRNPSGRKPSLSGASRAGEAKARDLPISKYALYEKAVQCPEWHAEFLPQMHRWVTKKSPLHLREDFCGTSRISCEWVKLSSKHTATGLDLDPEPLQYAEENNLSKLSPKARSRIRLLKQDVLKPTNDRYDLIAACNFSFFIFHERATMLEYARAAWKSLNKGGTFFLEMAGGEGMLEKIKETRKFRMKGLGICEYTWQQHDYDPIQMISDYSIHFRLPNGRRMKDAFTYHWRLWGIREVREILIQAGFRDTVVFWETSDRRGEGTGEYIPLEEGDHSHAWITYVVGVK